MEIIIIIGRNISCKEILKAHSSLYKSLVRFNLHVFHIGVDIINMPNTELKWVNMPDTHIVLRAFMTNTGSLKHGLHTSWRVKVVFSHEVRHTTI